MKVRNTIWAAFSLFWVLVLGVEYLQKHPLYPIAFSEGLYLDLILGKFALAAVVGYLVYRYNNKTNKYLRGIALVAWTLLWLWISLAVYDARKLEPAGLDLNVLPAVGKLLLLSGKLLVIILSFYSAGYFFLKLFRISPSHPRLLSIASGMMVYAFLLFLLGTAGGMHPLLMWPLILVPLLIGYKPVLRFLSDLLWKIPRWKPVRAGWSVFFLILIADLVALNMMQAATPMPKGFDALTYYANLPRVLADTGSLAGGYAPYNWSLLQSLGWLLFDSPELTHLISFSGGLLALFAFYSLIRGKTGMEPRWILLAALLWYSLPAVFTQSAFELKIDLGLLFVQLVVLQLALDMSGKDGWQESSSSRSHLLLFGLFLGFLLGIKLTAIIFIIPVLLLFWFKEERPLLILSVLALAISLVLAIGLDRISGSRAGLQGIPIFAAVLIVVGLTGLFIFWKEEGRFIIATVKKQLLIVLICLLSFSPWVVKNGLEAGRWDLQSLMYGKGDEPQLTREMIIDNWREAQQDGGGME